MQRSFGFPGWCAICRWTAVGAISVGTMAVLGSATSDHRPAPTVVRLAAQPEGTGLDWPGWTVRDPAEQRRSLDLLLNREKDRRAATAKAAATSIVSRTATAAPASPSSSPSALPIPRSALGQGTTLAAPQAVSVAIRYALAQVGKPYVWGATGPDSYDCSGLVQRSYAMAGIALPRTSREQARVGKAVELPDLLPGDLLFWAYDPSDLSTVHHVALYLGDGKIVQSPQPGEFVEVTTMWLSGYAGAVRVATGPATAALPPVPVGVPGTGITPVGDAMRDGSPPPPVLSPADPRPRIQHQSAASPQTGSTSADGTPGTSSPGSASPDSTSPGTTAPGTSSPGTTSPGTTSPGTSAPGGTSPGSSAPGTTSTGTTSTGSTSTGSTAPASASGGSSPAGSQQPSGSTSGTGSPATSSAAPDPTAPAPTSSEPHSSAPAPAPSSTAPPATTPPSTTPPPPAPSPSGDATSDSAVPATTTSAPPEPSVSPSSATPSPS